jgi:hypothetical protein
MLANGMHDHSQHLDTTFVKYELSRVSSLEKTELIKNIGEYKFAISDIN